jgi:hypothetical protein
MQYGDLMEWLGDNQMITWAILGVLAVGMLWLLGRTFGGH